MIPVSRDLRPSQAGRTCQSLNGLPKCPVLRATMMTSNGSDGAHCRHLAIDSTLPFIDPAAVPNADSQLFPVAIYRPASLNAVTWVGKAQQRATPPASEIQRDTARSKKCRGLRG